jgi:hypothetical protein
VGELHHRGPIELAVVGGEPNLARLLDDRARHLHLAVVEVAQRAVGLDARDADQPDVDAKLLDELHRRLADDAAVARAHQATGDDHLAIRVVRQDRGHVEVVGDDAQALVLQQFARHRLGGGADVDDHRAALRHGLRHRARDLALGLFVQMLALAIADVLGGRARHARATVKACQQAGVGQQADVAPHRLQGDAEAFGHCLDRQHAVLAHRGQQIALPRIGREAARRMCARAWARAVACHVASMGSRMPLAAPPVCASRA